LRYVLVLFLSLFDIVDPLLSVKANLSLLSDADILANGLLPLQHRSGEILVRPFGGLEM
jgi:hypothetical protein